MAQEIKGIKRQPILQAEETGQVDRQGADSITLVEMLHRDQFPKLVRRIHSPHPRFTSLSVSKVSWDLGKNGFYRVSYLYEGYLIDVPEEPTYELQGSTNEEPIQTHPQFLAMIGTPSAPLNHAVFEDPKTGDITTDNAKGVFREFGFKGEKAGVESYLTPGVTWTKRYLSRSRPNDLTNLGNIETPEGPYPSLSPRTWLFLGCSYSRKGTLYDITKTWLLSDRNGWDTDIY